MWLLNVQGRSVKSCMTSKPESGCGGSSQKTPRGWKLLWKDKYGSSVKEEQLTISVYTKRSFGEQTHPCLRCFILDSNWSNLKLSFSWEMDQFWQLENINGACCVWNKSLRRSLWHERLDFDVKNYFRRKQACGREGGVCAPKWKCASTPCPVRPGTASNSSASHVLGFANRELLKDDTWQSAWASDKLPRDVCWI